MIALSRKINTDKTRRQLLQTSLFSALAAFMGGNVASCGGGSAGSGPQAPGPVQSFGPLQDPDGNGVRLPMGFESRIVARSGVTPLLGTGYNWHDSPDGGATFGAQDGGWIYVSNSEVETQGGGAGAIRFDSAGQIIDAYSILSNTTNNCSGGPTPWDTWLSCEEITGGNVWECDPFGGFNPVQLPALGSFMHEAAAIDPVTGVVYMTEDEVDGRFYRFISGAVTLLGLPDLSTGSLQVAEVIDGLEGRV